MALYSYLVVPKNVHSAQGEATPVQSNHQFILEWIHLLSSAPLQSSLLLLFGVSEQAVDRSEPGELGSVLFPFQSCPAPTCPVFKGNKS